MPTVLDHFHHDHKALNANLFWDMRLEGGVDVKRVLGKISFKLEDNSKYLSLYFPAGCDLSCIRHILEKPFVLNCSLPEGEPDLEINYVGSSEKYQLSSHRFTGRVYLYTQFKFDEPRKDFFTNKLGKLLNLDIIIRDENYTLEFENNNNPKVFISHDSRDKDDLVRELAYEMQSRLCPVWYDEFSLSVGDSLTESIDEGLKKSEKCILIISPSFIENERWAKRELKSILAREIVQKKQLILPVWHNVSEEDVFNLNAYLVDILGLSSDIGVRNLADELVKKINDA